MPQTDKAMALQVPWFVLSSVVVISRLLVPVLTAAPAANSSIAPSPLATPGPGCPTTCGNVQIPYPFGLSDDCSWKGQFTVTCNHSFSPPKPLWGDMVVIDISVEKGEVRVFSPVAYICYNSSHTTTQDGVVGWTLNLTDTPMLISSTRNEFVAIGCSTVALIQGKQDGSFFTGCISTCVSLHDAAEDGAECTGLGCCQTDIPPNLSTVEFGWRNGDNNVAWGYSPCSYAFVAQKGWYHFRRRDLTRVGNKSFTDRVGEFTIPVVIDWAIRTDDTCHLLPDATGGTSLKPNASACVSTNSYCTNATQGPGYLCKCSKGYTGNPYISGGCTNINECNSMNDPCGFYSTCEDTDGDYFCKCKFNRKGNGKSEEGCHEYIFSPYAIAAVATFVVLVLGCIVIMVLLKANQKKLFLKNNGGKILMKAHNITIYTEREVKKITGDYKKCIGSGHYGTVYVGRIDGAHAQQVAVKKPVAKNVKHVHFLKKNVKPLQKIIRHEEQQNEQEEDEFVNEITFQFSIRHTNMVKLLGCCLETEIPILVFEFVSNGSLHDALHGANKPRTISLLKRLDIAIGSAQALSHMHSQGDQKHVHGDIKSENILLDENLNPKVSDFGSSKLLSVDSYFKGIVAGDMTYIDPVYLQTLQFTVKSDVYSFGVVLLELITRKKATYDGTKGLLKCFQDNVSGRIMFDIELFSGDDTQCQRYMLCLERIGMLAVRCLMVDDLERRPTMAEVVEELEQVKVMASGGSEDS